MSVDAAQAEFLDEPLPHSPLRNRLSEALPKAPVGLQWHIKPSGDEVVLTLQSREGTWYGGKSINLPAYAKEEAQIVSAIAAAARELSEQHTRRSILRELSGAYEGSTL